MYLFGYPYMYIKLIILIYQTIQLPAEVSKNLPYHKLFWTSIHTETLASFCIILKDVLQVEKRCRLYMYINWLFRHLPNLPYDLYSIKTIKNIVQHCIYYLQNLFNNKQYFCTYSLILYLYLHTTKPWLVCYIYLKYNIWASVHNVSGIIYHCKKTIQLSKHGKLTVLLWITTSMLQTLHIFNYNQEVLN